MPLVRENIDRFFDYDLHVESRTIYLGDPSEDGVDHLMASQLIKAMRLFEHAGKDLPITIILNSFGGCWYNGMAIYDVINDSSCYVTIEVLGSAMSMGAVILQAADLRVIHQNSTLMLHDGFETRTNDTPKTFEAWAEQSKISRKQMYAIFAEKSGKPVSYWERKCASDYILSAKEALEEGLVDKIYQRDEPV